MSQIFKSVSHGGRVILSFDRMRDEASIDPKQCLDWPFLERLRSWVGKRSMNLVLNGSEAQYRAFREAWPQLAEHFVPVRLPHFSEIAREQILKLEIDRLQVHHLVTISDQAVQAASKEVGSWSSEAQAEASGNHPWQVVQLLDSAASHVSLDAQEELSSPELDRTLAVIQGFRDQKEECLAKNDFSAAKKFHDATVDVFVSYVDALDGGLPIVEAGDVKHS